MAASPVTDVTVHDGWIVTSEWADIGTGRLEPVNVKFAREDGGPVLADSIRKLPVGTILNNARGTLARQLLSL